MFLSPARDFSPGDADWMARTVVSRNALYKQGFTPGRVRAQVDARRWQFVGLAVVRHNGPLSRRQRWDAALVNAGPRAALTGFTALEQHGLTGWQRNWVDVLVPVGVPVPRIDGIQVRLHRTRLWKGRSDHDAYRVDALPHALVVAARSFRDSRSACGLFAAAVQQGLAAPEQLLREVSRPTCTRHARVLKAALLDIAGGSESLAEIDFARLCRRYRLPEPVRQARRRDHDGRERYLDAYWELSNGRRVVAEVDGALHLGPERWWEDQARQNALSLDVDAFLRFPSWALRRDQPKVARQLRAALFPERA